MNKFKVVNIAKLPVQTGAVTSVEDLLFIREGTIVEKLGERGDWYEIKTIEGTSIQGWAESRYLEIYYDGIEKELFGIDSNLKERKSPLTQSLIDDYFREKNSNLEGIGLATIEAYENYGINPTYIIAHAILETGWGNSNIYLDKNNLFGWGAYDSDPYRAAMKFESREDCIDYVMKKINTLYLSKDGLYFEKRSCLGNKVYGMNVHYATDPNWGLNIATICRQIEAWASQKLATSDWTLTPLEDASRIITAVETINPNQSYYLKRDITGDEILETFCNWFVYDVLEELGINLPIYGESAGKRKDPKDSSKWKSKPLSAKHLNQYFQKENKWKDVNRSDAGILASQGKIVVASVLSHIALVMPNSYQSDIRIAQAGATNGTNLRLEQGFGNRDVCFFTYVDVI